MTPSPQPTLWQAGLARRDITPRESIWLAGYGARTAPSTGVRQPLHAKALALRDAAGTVAVLLTTDLIGYGGDILAQVRRAAQDRFGLSADRLLLAASHSHSSPVAGELLHAVYPMDAEQRTTVTRYTIWVVEQLIETIGESLEGATPAELSFGQGLAGFGVNRRRSRGTRHLPGPVDQDVPVLAVRDRQGELLAVVFGYACHTTTSTGQFVHGDYAGYAQAAIEAANPRARAMFVAGCGADINPLPRCREDLSGIYGDVLALAVQQVLEAPMHPLSAGLATALGTVSLPLQPTPTRAELESRRAAADPMHRRAIDGFLGEFERNGCVRPSCAYDIAAWRLGGELTLLALSGEVVVDYALRFKARLGWDKTWVAGYCNELVAYIPSDRVLREGGYEGGDAMSIFGYSAHFAPGIEALVAGEVEKVVGDLTPRSSPSTP